MVESYPRKPPDLPASLPVLPKYWVRYRTFNGWSWCQLPGQTTWSVWDHTGKLRARNAKSWRVASAWALAHCNDGATE